MSSGGSRLHGGPPPDPDALRQDRPGNRAEWVTLPAEGREGDPPPWPLTRMTARERERWAHEWAKPQAAMWEAAGQVDQVALYVRAFVEAERPRSSVALRQYVKQLEEVLGLSLTGLARNKWRIGSVRLPVAERPTGTEGAPAKQRFTVVDGGR